jgi:hypothetical protein
MDAIIQQLHYILHRLARIDESKIHYFLEAVRKKHIDKFEFLGVEPNSNKAKCNFCVEIDWIEQKVSIPSLSHSTFCDSWEDNINPDIRYEAQRFLERCKREVLEIRWSFTFTESGKQIEDELHKKLGTKRIIFETPLPTCIPRPTLSPLD